MYSHMAVHPFYIQKISCEYWNRRASMKKAVEVTGKRMVIHVPKELDHHTALPIRQQSEEILQYRKIAEIEMDFSQTEFMDSSGIGMLMGRYRQISHMGGQMYAVHVGERVRKILDMAGISKVVEIRGV